MVQNAINTLRAGRVLAIDAFRGITFLAMIFVNELGGVGGITRWLKHMPADADAMSFPDIVFPAFLFIVGMSIPFSINARLMKGDSAIDVQRHILYRAFALIVLGFFMVNAEEGFNAQTMPISIHAWSLLFYAAVFLVWGVFRFENVAVTRALRVLGIAIIVALAFMYRGGTAGQGWMTPQWWGILGLIGWAYFYSCEFYLLSRGKLPAVLGFLVFCVAYYVLAHSGGLQSSFGWFFSQEPHAAHSEIVLTGVACALIFFDEKRSDSNRRRFVEALVFGIALVVAAFVLRPQFKISKIYATPSWCLYSAAICIAVFSLLYGLIDMNHRERWTRFVEPAASSPLITYLIPFVVVAVLSLLGVDLPAVLRNGAAGLLWAAFYSCLIVWIVSLLNRRGVALKI
jgi:heparan-alpha-glucosaminide N-acetyltransferase